MSDKDKKEPSNLIDDFFDAAEGFLDKAERIGAPIRAADTPLHDEAVEVLDFNSGVQTGVDNLTWGCNDALQWHAFEDLQTVALCGKPQRIKVRRADISATPILMMCTACIMRACRRP